MQRCPICRARLQGSEICPRCGADLTLSLQVLKQARRLQQRTIALLAAGDWRQARQTVAKLRRVHRDELSEALQAFIERQERLSEWMGSNETATDPGGERNAAGG